MKRSPSTQSDMSAPSGAGPDPGSTGTSDSSAGLSRRNILKRAVGLAAVGAVAGPVLSETFASPASAATTTQPGALAPAVVALTDGPQIAVDASLGNDFRVTIASSRTMENPVNPSDGQKIVFQITQGTAGSSTITWGSVYEFSTGLPQPTLSTTPGLTDLLAFIYNAAKGKWLLAAFVSGFTTPPVIVQTGTFRLFPTTSGPASPASYGGSFLAGVLFQVTSGGTWFQGYWWWVCPSGQSTAPQKFALWAVYNDGLGSLVPGTTVTSAALTAGQWNYIPLPTPVPLAPGACYNACTGFSGSFPDTNGQFGAGEPYGAGIVNGPLSAFSDQSGSNPAPFSMTQGVFSVSGHRPDSEHARRGLRLGQLLDGPSGGDDRAHGHVVPAVAELPDSARRLCHRQHSLYPGDGVCAV